MIRCRIWPYLIKAATLRAAAPGRARSGHAALGPTRRVRAGQSGAPNDASPVNGI